MGTYIVKMRGEKVRSFNDLFMAKAWAKRHCHGKVEIVSLCETVMPRAEKRKFNPNMDMPDLRYKPFTSIN